MKLLLLRWCLLGLFHSQLSAAFTADRSDDACTALSSRLPGKISYPNSTQYAISNNYWSERQSGIHPACFFTPESTGDVSTAIKILTSLLAPFTVKSGGHTAFAGGSNIQNGVTIDLVRLNQIAVSDDRQTVSIGPGNRWLNVSQTLDPLGLAVVGGRVSDVGVGGLILGGGISYFSGRYGWACDNVRNFEVVLASGEIVNASPDQNTQLFWALRGGGGSNFGIVTRFDLVAFDQGDVWLYQSFYPLASTAELIPAFVDLAIDGLPADLDAHTFMVIANAPELGGELVANYMYHAVPPSSPADTPSVFVDLKAVPGAFQNATTVANVSTQSIAISEPYGARKAWSGTSIHLKEGSAQLLQDIVPLWKVHANRLLAAGRKTNETVRPFLVYQPISVNILEAMQKNGGNALGLSPEEGPLVHIHVPTHWESPELDCIAESSIAEFISQIHQLAEKRGLASTYTYMNYAGKYQDVYGGYGAENHERLRRVAETYDSERVLERLWTGYFKV